MCWVWTVVLGVDWHIHVSMMTSPSSTTSLHRLPPLCVENKRRPNDVVEKHRTRAAVLWTALIAVVLVCKKSRPSGPPSNC